MSKLTTLTRMWLTRSRKPFQFKNEYDNHLEYSDCQGLGLYVHVPFCKKICTFCPYCKEVYEAESCQAYIHALLQEIHMVGRQMEGKKEVTSLYFGGGTPALIADRLKEVIEVICGHFIITEGIGVELHPENVEEETLRLLKEAGVTKISIGMQSFQEKHLSKLGREKVKLEKIREALEKVTFETVSMDFIFALPDQTLDDLKQDIDTAFSSGANHIAVYPFIDFSFAKSGIPVMTPKAKRKLLDDMTRYCQSKGYVRDSIWTFSKGEEAKYSSMTRDNFLGFGCSATTLLKDQFKVNTFSAKAYKERIEQGELPTALTLRFTKRQRMIYYLFWTAYSTRVRASDFEAFFGIPLKKVYRLEFWLAQRLGFLTKVDGVYEMTLKGAFYYHYYEQFYTLSYIDQMWHVMRQEAFPEGIKF